MRRLSICLALAFSLTAAVAQDTPKHLPVLDVTSMDTSVDPCTDFYTYSCGGWMKANPIPPDQTSWTVDSKLEDDNKLILRDVLETAAKTDTNRDATNQKIGDYYSACMDEKAIDAAGAKPLQPALDRIAALHSKDELADVAAQLVNANILFSFGSNQDYKNSSEVIAETDQGGLGLPDRDYYFKDDPKSVELRKTYVAHVEKMFELLGDKPADAQKEAETVLRIETALAKVSLTRVERRDPQRLYHRMPLTQLQAMTPAFQWSVYMTKVGLPSVDSLNVATPEFFKAMNAEIKKEPLDNWKAYLRWHLANENAEFLATPFVNEDFAFYGKTLRGQQELEPRWKRCVGYVDNDLGEALGKAFVERTFSPEAKARALVMVHQIEAAMEQDINSLPWMTAVTKQHAIEKLHSVANKIGYPDKWRDYSSLTVVRDDEMGNVLRARIFEFNRQLAKIGKPVDRGEWQMSPPTVNAYYDPQKNDINFPAGILQPPFFDIKSDDAPNYGDTGSTIGHELTHGFDDEGRQFDSQGNLRDWWTAEDTKQFTERAACISTQYSQYVIVDDIKINGKLTLGEDVADVGGILLAYMAWKDQTKDQKLEPLEGFTPEQRFFIGYAQDWCGNIRDESKRLRATVDPHSPDKYRANGVVSNMPQFQQAFQCKTGAPMAPANRCRVW